MSTLVGMARHNIYNIKMLKNKWLQGNISFKLAAFHYINITFVRLQEVCLSVPSLLASSYHFAVNL